MGRDNHRCTICGATVVVSRPTNADPDLWQSEFRIVYSDHRITAISGVGLLGLIPGSGWLVPQNPTSHWSDADNRRDDYTVIPRMTSIEGVSPYYGFAFHEACWKLLQKHFQPAVVPLQRFHDVCNSTTKPMYLDTVSWGHDYLGLAIHDQIYWYPYEHEWRHLELSDVAIQMAATNPYRVADIVSLIASTSHLSSVLSNDLLITVKGRNFDVDCFFSMPWEIRVQITQLLSTKDALNLRLVSPAFLGILSDRQFWKSRFDHGGELEFLFEARDRNEDQDWRRIYKEFQRLRDLPGILNRIRVWKLSAIVRAHLILQISSTQHDPVSETRQLSWTRAAARITPLWWAETAELRGGSRLLTETVISVPQQLRRVAVSVLRFGAVSYIVGLKLFSASSTCPQSQLGYTTGGEESFCDTSTLHGFELAIEASGICALRIVRENGDKSIWFGNPEDSPITRRLHLRRPVQAIKAELDGYKIIGLSVGESTESENDDSVSRKISFRDAMIWYPEIPSAELCLNEETASIVLPSSRGYHPMNWICFGGPDGALLPQLTKISSFTYNYVFNIEFHYDNDGRHDKEQTWMKLGRNLEGVVGCDSFQIDGAGGELITSVEVCHEKIDVPDHQLYHGRLSYMTITTNWNRSHIFGEHNEKMLIKKIEVAPGTTIVGIYGLSTRLGICDLGVISRKLRLPRR